MDEKLVPLDHDPALSVMTGEYRVTLIRNTQKFRVMPEFEAFLKIMTFSHVFRTSRSLLWH